MDTCHFCHTPIAEKYYRVGPVMVCIKCVEQERENEAINRRKYFWRGLSFALLAALAGCLAKSGVDALLLSMGSTSLFSADAWIRGFVTILLGRFIGGAAILGSVRRKTRALQACSVVLVYLAYSMAIVPLILSHAHGGKTSATFVATIMLLAPVTPFWAVVKSPIAISGLIVLGIACLTAWNMTEPTQTVEGPFESTVTESNVPSFKTLDI